MGKLDAISRLTDLFTRLNAAEIRDRLSRWVVRTGWKFIGVAIAVLAITVGLAAEPVMGAPLLCRTLSDHEICLMDVQRSAKNHWEYRAIIQIDGVKRPQELYNCRRQVRIMRDRSTVPFEENGAGKLLCKLLDRR